MKYRISTIRVDLWKAHIEVVDVDVPGRTITISMSVHEPVTEEILAEHVRVVHDMEEAVVGNMDMLLKAQRTGQVLEA